MQVQNQSAGERLESLRLMFLELTQGKCRAYMRPVLSLMLRAPPVCLWGNSTDLSLLINMTEEQIKSLQSTGGEALAETEKNILGNHMSRLWEVVRDLKKTARDGQGGRIDFVLDNAGFELYCDCVYGSSVSVQSGNGTDVSDSRLPDSERSCQRN